MSSCHCFVVATTKNVDQTTVGLKATTQIQQGLFFKLFFLLLTASYHWFSAVSTMNTAQITTVGSKATTEIQPGLFL
jgi:hypothetical protein